MLASDIIDLIKLMADSGRGEAFKQHVLPQIMIVV